MTPTQCIATTVSGAPCDVRFGLDDAGLCQAHRPGGAERLREIGAKGGTATGQRLQTAGFPLDELTPIRSVQDAQHRIARVAELLLAREITQNECDSVTRAMREWVAAEKVAVTARIEGELRASLEAKKEEIESLRRQLAAKTPALRAS